jgi:hypothetical protein
METTQKSNWLIGFMDHLRGLIKEPPYLAFFFVSTILLIVIFFRPITYYHTFLAFFLYSIFGIIFRHAIKDIRGMLKEAYPNNFSKKNLWLTLSYHLINLIAVFVLIFVIIRYCI